MCQPAKRDAEPSRPLQGKCLDAPLLGRVGLPRAARNPSPLHPPPPPPPPCPPPPPPIPRAPSPAHGALRGATAPTKGMRTLTRKRPSSARLATLSAPRTHSGHPMHRTEKNTERGRAGQPVEGGRATQTREPACLRQPCRFLAAALAAPCAPLRAPARSRGALVTPSLHRRGLERVTRRASTLRRPNENAQRSKHRRGVAAATSARRTRRRARVGHHAGTPSAGRAAQQGLAAPGGRAARSARSSKAEKYAQMRA